MSKLEIQDLVKRFGQHLVVDHVSFSVDEGEFFVLLGPSGGGKTTLLRMICGLEKPDEGRIFLGQQDVSEWSPRQRNLGMVFQDYGLYPTMDVAGNIAYGLENRHLPRPEIQQRVQEAAAKLKLTPLLQRTVTELSGGEQQRVALARILARDADAFLYDEPLANLDPKLRYQARRDILTVHQLRKKPSLYVTHDQNEAFAIGDRIGLVAQGRLQQVGSPETFLDTPANLFVARFIGSPPMNLLPGRLHAEDEQLTVQIGSGSLPLPAIWHASLAQRSSAELIVGLRPQALVPAQRAAAEDAPRGLLHATVTEIEPLIGELLVTCRLASEQTLLALWPDMENEPPIDAPIDLAVDPLMLCLFDPTTEMLIPTERVALS